MTGSCSPRCSHRGGGRRAAVLCLAFAFVLACSEDSNGPTNPGPGEEPSPGTEPPPPGNEPPPPGNEPPPSADLSITKTVDQETVDVGATITYEIVVANAGPDAAVAVVVTDVLPPAVAFMSVTSDAGSCAESGGTVTCDVGDLPLGGSVTIEIEVTAEAAGTLDNTATVAADTPDPDTGNDAATASTTVEDPPTTITASSVEAGGRFTCGLDAAGQAYCWGLNNVGQLGNGTLLPADPTLTEWPAAVVGGHVFSGLSAGESYGCGLTTSGAAYCWGLNNWAQHGNGSLDDTSAPAPVAGGHTFTQIATSTSSGTYRQFTCALDGTGAAWCWGGNSTGQLGIGNTDQTETTPVAVTGGHVFVQIVAGDGHACGLEADGDAWCWGANRVSFDGGRLGDGTTSTESTVPVPVVGGITFSQLAAADQHTCGLDTSGAAWCWGENDRGQLGDGTYMDTSVPVAVAGGRTYATIDAGGSRSATLGNHTCALEADGTAWCWGHNGNGELGIGTTGGDSNLPVAVAGGHLFGSISLGRFHTCALDQAGDLYCWGANGNRQLAIENRVAMGGVGSSDVPVAVVLVEGGP